MGLLVLVILLVLLFGGGGSYWGYRRYGNQAGGIGIVGMILIVFIAYYFIGRA